MENFSVTILGSSSASPTSRRNTSSQLVNFYQRLYLIDCGEGTQVQLRKNKIRFSKINHIFISHLHGDHFFGLVGLLSTYGILSREKELHIYGPKGIKEVTLLSLKISQSHAKYKMIFHELVSKESEVIFEDEKVSVSTIPLRHRVYTNGYLFTEKESSLK